jgi:hypothetical protein
MSQVMVQHIWKAWTRDYLSQLRSQTRPKWYTLSGPHPRDSCPHHGRLRVWPSTLESGPNHGSLPWRRRQDSCV